MPRGYDDAGGGVGAGGVPAQPTPDGATAAGTALRESGAAGGRFACRRGAGVGLRGAGAPHAGSRSIDPVPLALPLQARWWARLQEVVSAIDANFRVNFGQVGGMA